MSKGATSQKCLDDLTTSGSLKVQNGFPCGNWNDKGAGVLQLRPFNITDGGQIDLSSVKFIETDKKLDNYLLRNGDVIFNNTNSEALVGKTAYWARDDYAVLSNHMTILRVLDQEALSGQFLAFYLLLKWYDGHFHSRCQRHINQASVGKDRLGATMLPPIDLPEQKKIAHILSSVQRAIEVQERIIQTTTELKKALMHKLFIEGMRGEPQKETEIGPIPESWEVKPLIDTVEFIDYGVSQAIPKTPTPEGVKIVSTADIDKQGNLLYWKIRRIVVPAKTAKRLVLKDGDVLFNWRNSAELIGKSTIYEEQEEPHIFASFILRICTGETKSHNYFLKHLMNHYREEGVFEKLARRAVNQANYNKNEISVLKIPSPPYDEQVQIAIAIGAIDAKTRNHINKKCGLEDLFYTLLHELMSDKTRVHELEISA
jgi:type I restriction enzyme S subunit